MITTEDQLKNKANFLGNTGMLFLVRCMNCPDVGERGSENYGVMVATGRCAWCSWEDTRTIEDCPILHEREYISKEEYIKREMEKTHVNKLY